jgi:hypothetical protein
MEVVEGETWQTYFKKETMLFSPLSVSSPPVKVNA